MLIKQLVQDNRDLKRANEILRRALTCLRPNSTASDMTVRFIDENKVLGVKPILQGTTSRPQHLLCRRARPPCQRALRDVLMLPVLLARLQANYSVYGAHKLWKRPSEPAMTSAGTRWHG